jgi:hypothetical protein
MNIFKNRVFTWWQVGLLKTALLFIGISIGANWPEVFVPFITVFVVVGFLIGGYIAYATMGRD